MRHRNPLRNTALMSAQITGCTDPKARRSRPPTPEVDRKQFGYDAARTGFMHP